MVKTGVIVARFQCSYLHEGHRKLIQYVKDRSDNIIILLGTNETRLTNKNPLSFFIRKKMIQELYPEINVVPIYDRKSDSVWSDILDSTIKEWTNNEEVILYGSRDSFIPYYTGQYKTESMALVSSPSATEIRNKHHELIEADEKWRQGVIWASAHKYPTSYQTVDIAIVRKESNKVLLGKKPDEDKYRFVGGFVDVSDDSLEMAAKREAREECGDISTDNYKYIGSFRIDDFRYRHSQDKIMTAFFYCQYIYGHTQAQDDISQLEWFDISALSKDDIEPEHHLLLEAFLKYKP